ncbi:MAG: efflux transporter outer membrane subunit [Acetobacteraceae bacterium]|nr:efflux transporter outer membrane subunit [Acetobacteraceae bacterium]
MRRSLNGALALLLAGCTVGPTYQTPSTAMTDTFKEATPADYRTAGTWRPARPDDALNRGKWWEIYGDQELDSLEDQLTGANQNLKIAEARFREARAMIGYQRASEFPTISVGVNTTSLQNSNHQPYFLIPNPPPEGELQLPFDLSYEIDLWGRIRRTVSAAREEAQATAGDLATVSLSLHAELALDYIELRSADAQRRLLNDTVTDYTNALRLTQNRLAGGDAPESDVAQAQTQLDMTRVQATDIGVMRAQYEHAIATLVGEPPAAFSLSPAPLDLQPPVVPPGVPSELLQRRPDIAATERRVAEANDQIGIAQAAYYPSLNLNAVSGFEGTSGATWFGWPSLFWAVGTSMTQELFDGGRLHAQSQIARASYDAAVASYRQTTLTAFQQVEDNLAALRILGDEAQQQHEAVASADNALRIFTNRYLGGEDAYLQVITAQTAALANQRNDVDIQRRRMEACVLLVKALGGGWNSADLPQLTQRGIPPGSIVPLGQ